MLRLRRARAGAQEGSSSRGVSGGQPAPRVLILSASMGAGHDGAARELAVRLRTMGHEARVVDFLDAGPARVGRALRRGYEFELKHIPSAYDLTYRFWYRAQWLCPLVAWLVCILCRRRVLRWVREDEADVVVSTYPLATLCIGRLRWLGRLEVPVVNFITDFGVHPLWVHRGIDLNLAIHDEPARVARRRAARPAVGCGPVVSFAFTAASLLTNGNRLAARRKLGLNEGARAVLVVAGSWGVGALDETLQAIARGRRFLPVVVCGRDEALRRRIDSLVAASGLRAVVMGWTDEMAQLMSACDALVENAGGLTSLEAMRARLPVVSFRPIAGHGRDNTAAMSEAGVSRMAHDADELQRALEEVTEPGPERSAQLDRALAMFRDDAASLVASVASAPGDVPLAPAWHKPVAAAVRVSASLAAAMGLVWAGLTAGVSAAAAAGAGVAHARPAAGAVAYLGVRLDSSEVVDPAIVTELRAMNATAVVDQLTVLSEPESVRGLALAGIDVENGGRGEWYHSSGDPVRPAIWDRARADLEAGRALAALIGKPVTMFVPGRRVNAFDLFDSHGAHCSVVVPDVVLKVSDGDLVSDMRLRTHDIYLLNGLDSTPSQVLALLEHFSSALSSSGLSGAPLGALG